MLYDTGNGATITQISGKISVKIIVWTWEKEK